MKNILLTTKSAPVYSVLGLSEFLINPYREFVYFTVTSVFPELEHKSHMSMRQFYDMKDKNNQKELFKDLCEKNIPGIEITFNKNTSHKKIFVEANVAYNGDNLGTIQFFTHITYLGNPKDYDDANDDTEYVACEFNFIEFSKFKTLVNNDTSYQNNNIIDFSKDENDNDTIDMIIAHIKCLANFTDFVKYYKTRSIVTNNINMFVDKLIGPYVSDYQVIYTPEYFIVAVLCGSVMHKLEFSYNDYLNSIKDMAEKIKARYGEKYKTAKDSKKKYD